MTIEEQAKALYEVMYPETSVTPWEGVSKWAKEIYRRAIRAGWTKTEPVKPDYWHVYDLVDQALCDEETRAGQCAAATNEILRYFGHSDLVELEEYMNRVVDLVWPGGSSLDFEAFDNLRRAVKNGWIVLGDFKSPEGEE